MSSVKPPLDFTVVREHWNRYDLADNSILKVKSNDRAKDMEQEIECPRCADMMTLF
jgi:hypothetical protein